MHVQHFLKIKSWISQFGHSKVETPKIRFENLYGWIQDVLKKGAANHPSDLGGKGVGHGWGWGRGHFGARLTGDTVEPGREQACKRETYPLPPPLLLTDLRMGGAPELLLFHSNRDCGSSSIVSWAQLRTAIVVHRFLLPVPPSMCPLLARSRC